MRAHIITFGCQMNEYDSHLVASELVSLGWELVDSVEEADFVLVNTCAVRGKPVEKVRSLLGQLRKEKDRRGLLIGLMGCLAQLDEGQQMARKFGVDVLLGPGALTSLPEALKGNQRFWDLTFKDDLLDYIPPPPRGALSAHVTIIRGCNHHCTYCIIPTTRGPEVSRHPDLILKEIETLKKAGVVEVTLLGQNVNSYGKDLWQGVDFADLLAQIAQLPGEFLVRFMTSHPRDASPKLFDTMARYPKIAKQLHLPFQSGSSRVLKAMNRHYDRETYLEKVNYAKSVMPELVLTSDVIVGFPGETEEEFEQTVSLIQQVHYDSLFTFIFSPRTGTPAASMDDPTPKAEKNRRFDRLCAVQNAISEQTHRGYIGKVMRCLVDGRDGDNLTARTEGGRLVRFPGDDSLIGSFRQIEITGATTWSLVGTLAE